MQSNSIPSRCLVRGFTLIELLVVIAIIGILAALLFPVFSRAKQKGQGVSCLNNGKQMMLALTMYGSDSHEFFPPNPDDGNTIPGHNWCCGKAGRGMAEEFNPDVLKDPRRSLLSPYLKGEVSVFRCPNDKRMGIYQGEDPVLSGKIVPAARTFSMSQAVGTICPGFDAGGEHDGPPRLSVNGRWLNNGNPYNHEHRRDSPWLTYGKLSDVRAPGPSMLWVLVDEDAKGNGLNDAAFAFGMQGPAWVDLRGDYHDNGCGFAFADGHSETHKWNGHTNRRGSAGPGELHITDPPDMRDWLWMREHTSAHVSGTMPSPAP